MPAVDCLSAQEYRPASLVVPQVVRCELREDGARYPGGRGLVAGAERLDRGAEQRHRLRVSDGDTGGEAV